MGPPRIDKTVCRMVEPTSSRTRKSRTVVMRNKRQNPSLKIEAGSISSLLIGAIVLIELVCVCHSAEIRRSNQVGSFGKRSSAEKDFAPKLIHQPQSVHLQLNKPHTIECAVEAIPEAEVKWFKDDQLLIVQPPHLEQSGNELMFFQINEHDSGQYRCHATNYLGSVASDPLTLTVQSSVHEPRIRFEPGLTEVAAERQAEFTCTIPTLRLNQQQQQQQQQQPPQQQQEKLASEQSWPEVSWKRNGLPLQVIWLSNKGEDTAAISSDSPPSYLARRTKENEFVLTLTRVQLKDDNATFTCQYKWLYGGSSESSGDELSLGGSSSPDLANLARESSPARLRVHASQVKIVTNLAPPIENLANAKNPHELVDNQTSTTKSTEPPTKGGARNSLRQTLEDLFELAKPTLIFLGLLSLISSSVLLYLTLIKRKTRNQNRYMKHQYVGSDASSGASSAIGGPPDCGDPVLSSLMARTLSAPSAVSLAGATKKYRSYRDHLRKVAAVQDIIVGAEGDFVDGYFGPAAAAAPAHLRGQQISGSLSDQAHFFALPNLYNQSLAAREQARNLLQANEHVRSLSNLSSQHQKQHQATTNNATHIRQQMDAMGQMGSHLNLPLSFALGGANGRPDQQTASCQSNIASALWPLHPNPNPNPNPNQQQHAIARSVHQQQQQQQQRNPNQQPKHRLGDEHYQLANCNNPILANQFSGHNMIHAQNNAQPEMSRQHQHQQDPIYCTICDKELPNRYVLKIHMLKVHQINLEMDDEEPALGRPDDDRNNSNEEDQRHSSPSISVATSSNSTNDDQENHQVRKQDKFNDKKCDRLGVHQARLDSNSQNHYSTIESNDDEEDRYEEVEQTSRTQARINKVSSFVMADQQYEHIDNQSSNSNNNVLKNSMRFSIMSNSSSSGCGDSTNTTTSSSLSGDTATSRINSKRSGGQNQNKMFLKQDNKRAQHFQDQLSPYAVSSICNSIPPNHQPPPVPDSEAMKALYEQFDINQLMLLDESNSTQQTLPFDSLPPPPPPPTDSLSSSQTNDSAIRSQTRK